MIALCIDDEPIMLALLKEAVAASPDIEEVYAFEEEADALAWAQTHSFDVAFLDIELHDMTGTEVARRLRKNAPYLPVIFCTGYAEYALEAIQLHADGYLLKPIAAEDAQKELDRILGKANANALLSVSENGLTLKDKNGRLVTFSRSRTIELFRLLLCAKGELQSAEELCESLFGSTPGFHEKDRNYFFHLLSDLKTTLSACDAEEVLLKTGQGYGLRMNLIAVSGDES